MLVRRIASTALFCWFLAWSAPLYAQEVPGCGSLENACGPLITGPENKRDKLPMSSPSISASGIRGEADRAAYR